MSILEKIDHVRMGPGAHPIKDISIEFEIQCNFVMLWFEV